MYHDNSCNRDMGARAGVINICKETLTNDNFRTAIWTGTHLQITVMSIPVGGEIGLEVHDDLDQLLCIENGCADVFMGKCKDDLKFIGRVNSNFVIIVPSGTYHNVVNSANCSLKLFSVYAPPKHPFGTVHRTKQDSDRADY